MVKQTKSFKKGCIAKKSLAAILAASMVMTSSSMVFAAPVVEEETPVVEAQVVEDSAVVDENVGEQLTAANVTIADVTYTGSDLVTTIKQGISVKESNGTALAEGPSGYSVAFKNAAGSAVTSITNAGTYTAVFTITKSQDVGDGTAIEKQFTVNPFALTSANTSVSYTETGYIYDGSKQTPTATVSATGTTLKADDFDVVAADDASDMISAGNQNIKLQLKDTVKNYTVSGTIGAYTYAIDKSSENNQATVTAEDGIYTGVALPATVVVKVGKTVVPASTYSVAYSKGKTAVAAPTLIGKYDVTVTFNGTGNYTSGTTATGTYKIVASSLTTAAKSATIAGATKNASGVYELTYNGTAQSVKASDIVVPGLTKGTDYTVAEETSIGTNVADTATAKNITLTGMGKYAGETVVLNVKIAPKAITTTGYTISAAASKGATALSELIVSVKDGETELVAPTDYALSDIDTAKHTVVLKGAGNYTTATATDDAAGITLTYTQADKLLISDTQRVSIDAVEAQAYTGLQITPVVVVRNEKSSTTPKTALTINKDYTVAYGANVNTGKGTIIVTGMGDYEGTKTVEFNITGTAINATYELGALNNITLTEAKANTAKQDAKLVYKSNGASVPAKVTYEVKYYSDSAYKKEITDFAAFTAGIKTTPATVYVQATGTGAYSGSVKRSYQIVDGEPFTVDAIADQAYTGSEIKPAVVVKNTSGTVLKEGTDYTVTYLNNVDSGIAYAMVTGKGTYGGSTAVAFNIVGLMDQNIEFLSAQVKDIANRTMDSKATTAKYNKDKAPKTEDVEYTSSNPEVATVDAKTGAIAYVGVGTTEITVKAAASDTYKEGTATMTVNVLCRTPQNMTATVSGKKITVKADEVTEATKYQIYIKKAGKKAVYVNVDSTGDLSKVYTVKSTGKFTVKVRAYKPDGAGKNYLGAWSTAKTVTVK